MTTNTHAERTGPPIVLQDAGWVMEEHEGLVRRFITEVLDGRQVELADDFVTPDHIHHRSDGSIEHGIDARKASAAAWHAIFPDYRHVIEDLIVGKDRIVVRYTATGTYQGAHRARLTKGERLRWSGIFIYRITDGRIAETWVESAVAGRLGCLPAPER